MRNYSERSHSRVVPMQVFTERTPVRSRRAAQGGVEASSGRVGCGLSVQVNGVVIPASILLLISEPSHMCLRKSLPVS